VSLSAHQTCSHHIMIMFGRVIQSSAPIRGNGRARERRQDKALARGLPPRAWRPGDDLAALARAYAQDAWQVDAALIETIAAAETREDVVARAAGTLYRPWVDALARRFRAAHDAAGEPSPLAIDHGTPVLFVDGLRMDVGQAVAERLGNGGKQALLGWRLAPVPSVTATAKALVTPVGASIAGHARARHSGPLTAALYCHRKSRHPSVMPNAATSTATATSWACAWPRNCKPKWPASANTVLALRVISCRGGNSVAFGVKQTFVSGRDQR